MWVIWWGRLFPLDSLLIPLSRVAVVPSDLDKKSAWVTNTNSIACCSEGVDRVPGMSRGIPSQSCVLSEPKPVEFHEGGPIPLVFRVFLGSWVYEEPGLWSDYKMLAPPLEEKDYVHQPHCSTLYWVPLERAGCLNFYWEMCCWVLTFAIAWSVKLWWNSVLALEKPEGWLRPSKKTRWKELGLHLELACSFAKFRAS